MAFQLASTDTRAAADEGVWFTFEDLHGNEVYDDNGEPVKFRIAGRDAAVAKEAFRQIQGKQGAALEGAALAAVCKMVLGWSDNVEEEYTEANVRKVMEIPHVQEWVVAKVIDRANFSTKG